MELFDVLKKDHNQVKALCRRIQTAGGRSATGRKIFDQMSSMLEVHMQAEEHLFYSRLQESDKTSKFAIEGFEEHRLGRLLLSELKSKDLDSETWQVKFKVFVDIISHHIEEEEETFFEKGRSLFEEGELEELAALFNEQKKQLLAGTTKTTRRTRNSRKSVSRRKAA